MMLGGGGSLVLGDGRAFVVMVVKGKLDVFCVRGVEISCLWRDDQIARCRYRSVISNH